MTTHDEGGGWRDWLRRVGQYLWIGAVNPSPPPLPVRREYAAAAREPEPEVTDKTGLVRCPCCGDPVVVTLRLTTARDGWTTRVTAGVELATPDEAADALALATTPPEKAQLGDLP